MYVRSRFTINCNHICIMTVGDSFAVRPACYDNIAWLCVGNIFSYRRGSKNTHEDFGAIFRMKLKATLPCAFGRNRATAFGIFIHRAPETIGGINHYQALSKRTRVFSPGLAMRKMK